MLAGEVVMVLNEGWRVASSAGCGGHGHLISTPSFDDQGWLPVDLPCTFLDSQVRNGQLPDPYYGLHFKQLPGYMPVTQNTLRLQDELHNFSDVPMPADSPYRAPFWYRKTFELTEPQAERRVFLKLDGINYHAHVWINGRRVAGPGLIAGSQRRYELDLTPMIRQGANALAIQVFPPEPDDLAFTFADWNPMPPDKNAGIWQPVSLAFSGPATVRNTFVEPRLADDFSSACLEVSTDLENHTESELAGTLILDIEGHVVRESVRLAAGEQKRVKLGGASLRLDSPRLWWPWRLGRPERYVLEARFETAQGVSDQERVTFGIRKVTSRINEHGARQFTINGVDLLLRGAGWSPDLMMRHDGKRDALDISCAKHMGLDVIRLEGNLSSDGFFEICDREGMLVLSGWICCSYWERWTFWKAEDFELADLALRDQLRRLRNHPSLIGWLYGSDGFPPEKLERRYLASLDELAPDLPRLSSATAKVSPLTGPTGVKMSGPYAYVPPSYWYDPERPGFATGFNTETGPDCSIMAYESLCEMLPENQRFVGSEGWNLHLGVGVFGTTTLADRAIELRYGQAETLQDHCRKAAMLQYECWRAMFEAYSRFYPRGGGVIAWMLNNAWPNQVFHLYDWYFRPGGGYWAARKATEALRLQFCYDDHSVWALNEGSSDQTGWHARVRVLDLGLTELFRQDTELSLGAGERREWLRLPEIQTEAGVYFVDLVLSREGDKDRRNFYWLPTTRDVFVPVHTFYHTPLRAHADLSALAGLPPAELDVQVVFHREGDDLVVRATLANPTSVPSLLTEVQVRDQRTGKLVLPLFWDQNMFPLLPGERCDIEGRATVQRRPEDYILEVGGFNAVARKA